jgi:glycosyltransferase involved in cell wall biosynthesis
MAGPAIRAFELARALSDACDVTLAAPPPSEFPDELSFATCETTIEGDPEFDERIRHQDVVVAQLWPAHRTRYLAGRVHRLALDMYCPIYLESLEGSRGQGERARESWHGWLAAEIGNTLMAADYVICASERQRDLLLGGMMVTGRIEPHTYAEDRTYRSVIDVVPFGMGDTPPRHTRNVVKGAIPGISKDDKVLLWNGGVWNWLDPMTSIKAVELIAGKRDDVKLLFMSLSRSHAAEKIDFSTAAQALHYARDRDLEDSCVFFQSDWITYEDRSNYLLEADLGISTHPEHLETRFSLRSRLLDCVWAGLPIVATRGDEFAEWIDRHDLGATTDYEDAEGVAAAVLSLLDDPKRAAEVKRNLDRFGQTRTWSRVAQPLIDYCVSAREHPRRRRDAVDLRLRAARHFPSRLRAVYHREGPVSLTRFAIRKVLNTNGARADQ